MEERKMKSPSSPKSASRSGPIACPDYERAWRLGYGPPDGDKMDEAGWEEYFDAMPPVEYDKMIRRVHNLREPPPMWEGWRDELDNNLTSLSEAFKLHPECQLIWQKGYGPPDGDKLDVKGWKEYFDAMPEDKRFDMVKNLFDRPRDHHHDRQHDYVDDFDHRVNDELWEKYGDQFLQSEGFDIVDYPVGCCGIITPMFNDTCPVNAKTYHLLSDCSRMAVDAYNQREGTDYTVNRVTKVCAQLVAGMMYFITFEAINSSHRHQVFQAKVYAPPMMEAKEVVLVRPKA